MYKYLELKNPVLIRQKNREYIRSSVFSFIKNDCKISVPTEFKSKHSDEELLQSFVNVCMRKEIPRLYKYTGIGSLLLFLVSIIMLWC